MTGAMAYRVGLAALAGGFFLWSQAARAGSIEVKTDATWLAYNTTPASGWNSNLTYDTTGWVSAFKSPSGNNIWYGSNLTSSNLSPNQAWFRQTFTLSSAVSGATGDFFFDDDGEAYLNGHLIVSDPGGGATTFSALSIDPFWFNVGNNLLAIHGINTDAPFNNVAADVQITTVPEPATLLGLPAGLILLMGQRRKR